MTTDWRSHVSPLDAKVDGFLQPSPWSQGQTAPVSLDVTAYLGQGESVTNPTSILRKLPDTTEQDYTAVDELLDGAPSVVGKIIHQPLQGLVRGEVYRWEAQFGAVDNRRSRSLMVIAVE
jgi:hypothetical protein